MLLLKEWVFQILQNICAGSILLEDWWSSSLTTHGEPVSQKQGFP